MLKKVLLWARTTNIWIVMAQIYTLFLCLFMLKCHLWGSSEYDKYVGLMAFAFLILLSYRYNLYKKISWWIYALFFAMTYAAGFAERCSLMRIIGSSVHRNWYIYLLGMVIACVLEEKKKNRWMIALFSIQTTALSAIFVISIIGATRKLLNPDYKVLKGFGSFISGRLSTFTSANTAGPAAAVLILLSILLLYRTRKWKYRILTNILFSMYIFIGWVELGLTRSRGAILATAVAMGVFTFALVYDKMRINKIKAFAVGCVTFIGVTVISTVILLIPKPVFDWGVKNYVERTAPASGDDVGSKLEVYSVTYALDNLTDRTDIWSATIGMLDEKPQRWIWGITAQKASETQILGIYKERPEITMMSAHSGYLGQLYMYGIPGAAILALLLCIWIIRAMRSVFAESVSTEDKTSAALMAAAVVNAFVEAFLFPHYIVYPISFYFFVGEGCLEGTMEKKEKSYKAKVIVAICAVIGIAVVGYTTYRVFDYSRTKYEYVEEIEAVKQNPDDFVRLTNNVKPEMMSAEYWISLREAQSDSLASEKLSLAQINRFNHINRRMLTTANAEFSLFEIGNEFYYKVAKNFIKDTMKTIKEPSEYLANGVPTDREYWDSLEKNANLDALNERISVRFGISVSNRVLKRYPTNDDVYAVDSNMYYDELAQSDLLPFMPVAILHESADEEWYYVITYGYGGWVRKEYIALCASKEEWLSFAEPEDFIVVTGKELRIPTDPYTDALSGMIVPMGTKIPVVAIKDAPEDIHNRISFGNYVAKLPIRNDEGMAEDVYVLIPESDDVNLGYLPYTEENVAKLAFKHLGAGYGWAGDYNGQDCSGYVREIYACFGYTMPRSAKAQAEMECSDSYDVEGKEVGEIVEILKDAPIGTLLYFPGHIMIYLGMEDGVPYCISSVGNFATNQSSDTVVREANTVIITDMKDTVRANGIPWIASLNKIVIP